MFRFGYKYYLLAYLILSIPSLIHPYTRCRPPSFSNHDIIQQLHVSLISLGLILPSILFPSTQSLLPVPVPTHIATAILFDPCFVNTFLFPISFPALPTPAGLTGSFLL
ncbi:hypothetical protein CC2G_009507 [Coprinopsis cinerea AmutBmut pab1-1]|nr:hypothetical protein CC2G_004878 [Coprinopsis cinerea AmutBmut pab1-1]KAG2016331.1 hypothetical protein CC2G_009507 [Coprinopsis cinerea AmutBmut pab1-1]